MLGGSAVPGELPPGYQPADLLARARTRPMVKLLTLLCDENWRSVRTDRGPSFVHPRSGEEVKTPSYVPTSWWPEATYSLLRQLSVRLIAYHGDQFDLRAPFIMGRTGVPWARIHEPVLNYKKAMLFIADPFPPKGTVGQ